MASGRGICTDDLPYAGGSPNAASLKALASLSFVMFNLTTLLIDSRQICRSSRTCSCFKSCVSVNKKKAKPCTRDRFCTIFGSLWVYRGKQQNHGSYGGPPIPKLLFKLTLWKFGKVLFHLRLEALPSLLTHRRRKKEWEGGIITRLRRSTQFI